MAFFCYGNNHSVSGSLSVGSGSHSTGSPGSTQPAPVRAPPPPPPSAGTYLQYLSLPPGLPDCDCADFWLTFTFGVLEDEVNVNNNNRMNDVIIQPPKPALVLVLVIELFV